MARQYLNFENLHFSMAEDSSSQGQILKKRSFRNLLRCSLRNFHHLLSTSLKGAIHDRGVTQFHLTLCGPRRIKKLKKEYLGIDQVTDVLSFPIHSSQRLKGRKFRQPMLDLGDIFICRQQAKKQALCAGRREELEIVFLLTHGFLHLCGMDHANKQQEKIMFKLQEKLFKQIVSLR
jgi:probable rRNA maturation factor